MGGKITKNHEKVAALCAESLKKETDTLTRNRLSFIASECLNARANYNDYLLSKQLVAKSFREGLLGKEVAGLALVAIFFEANFALGTIVGRNSLNSFHAPVSRYHDDHDNHH